jgi:hypothetical protein
MDMPRAKKPSVPKFDPVFIAGYRPKGRSLATPDAESAKIRKEDFERIVAETMTANLTRLKVLQKYLGLEGELGNWPHLLMLLIAVADKYVDGFAVEVGKSPKQPGPKKIGDRFKTVTEVERRRFELGLTDISAAIEAVAAERRPFIRAPELSTKYYSCLKEIKANEYANALLNFWRAVMTRLSAKDLNKFDFIFWECERDYLGATVPHNVTPMKARKA